MPFVAFSLYENVGGKPKELYYELRQISEEGWVKCKTKEERDKVLIAAWQEWKDSLFEDNVIIGGIDLLDSDGQENKDCSFYPGGYIAKK